MKRILIIGGGPAGLITAYLLSRRDYNLTLVEKEDRIGGLLQTASIGNVDIELVYHHIMSNDRDLIRLIEDLNLKEHLIFNKSRIAVYRKGRFYDISLPTDYLNLNFLPFISRLKLIYRLALPNDDSQSLEAYFGKVIYNSFIRDMMINKFGEYYDIIRPAWFLKKVRKRGRSRFCLFEQLGYLKGSFDIFIKKIAENIAGKNCTIYTSSSVDKIDQRGDIYRVSINQKIEEFNGIIFTISPDEIASLIYPLNPDYSERLKRLRYMSNITALLYTKKNLTDFYWINIADADIKLTGIIAHSNLIQYGMAEGYFTYVSIYLSDEHPLLREEKDTILRHIITEAGKMGLEISKSELMVYRITTTRYAQPLYITEEDLILSPMITPLRNIFIINSHTLLPEDRGINNIIRAARHLSNILPDHL